LTRYSELALARIAKGGDLIAKASSPRQNGDVATKFPKWNISKSEHCNMSIEIPDTTSEPGLAARAIDTATDASRTMADLCAALGDALIRLNEAIATARRPGTPLSTISAVTREAPLASLFVAFLFGVAVARRR
jgi:hypothetical protein